MINRIRQFTEPEDAPRVGSFWVLRTLYFGYFVDVATAAAIARALRRPWSPRWLEFTDLAGSRCRVLTRDVRSLVETTPETRAADRRHERAVRAEEKADAPPPWAEE